MTADDESTAGPPAAAEPLRLPVAAVSRRLGIAPATLRTWDRRYGLGPTEHRSGSHRRYTPEDLARLARMRRLTLEGMSPAEAARMVREGGADPDGVPAERPARGGGGRVLALPLAPGARGLARAAMALDAAACTEILRAALADGDLTAWWRDLVVPVLVAVGHRYQTTGTGIEVEHVLSECVLTVAREAMREPAPAGPVVLLASAEEDSHTLPVHVLAAALNRAGVATRLLGARVPRHALAAAVRRIGPAAVFLWSSLPATGGMDQLREFPALRPAPRLVLGGPGWDAPALPSAAVLVASLEEAVKELAGAVGR